MAFGNDNKKSLIKDKAPDLEAFEKMAKNYELKTEEKEQTLNNGNYIESTTEEKRTVLKTTETETQIHDNQKKDNKKSSKKNKQPTAYYKNFYNLRIDLPKQSEPLIELAAKVYGSKKDYIMKLIRDDMKLHADEYRKQIADQDDNDNWDF